MRVAWQISCQGISRGHGSSLEGVHPHITHPFIYRRWEGYFWIDLNEYIEVEAQKVAKEVVGRARDDGVKDKNGV